MTRAAHLLALVRYEWSRTLPRRSAKKRWLGLLLGAFAGSVVICLAVAKAEPLPQDRLVPAWLCIWLFFSYVPVLRHAASRDELYLFALLPYRRRDLVLARMTSAYIQLLGWLALGALVAALGLAALHGGQEPGVSGAVWVMLGVMPLGYLGLAATAAASPILSSAPGHRWLTLFLDSSFSVVVLFMLEDVTRKGPLPHTHRTWIVVSLLYAGLGIVCAALAARILARGDWAFRADDGMAGRVAGAREVRAHEGRPIRGASVRRPEADGEGLIGTWRTAMAAFRLALPRALSPFTSNGGRLSGLRTSLPMLGLVGIAVAVYGWHAQDSHVFSMRLAAGLIGGAWFWSFVSGIAVAGNIEHAGDWLRGWPVRKEGVIAGFVLAEVVGMLPWMGAGALAGLVAIGHFALERSASAIDALSIVLSLFIAILASAWNTAMSAALFLGRARMGMTVTLLGELAATIAAFDVGGRLVAWLERTPWAISTGAALAALVVGAAAIAWPTRAAARRLMLP